MCCEIITSRRKTARLHAPHDVVLFETHEGKSASIVRAWPFRA